MKVDLIGGARPNFVKIASLIHANSNANSQISFRLIHTGQHYDEKLSNIFFRELEIPDPDFNLNIGSGSQAEQTGAIMMGYEKLLELEKPQFCLVVGDVTSSMACAITAKKMGVKVAHVEAGIRSQDWKMPEEVNRILIDSISDIFFTTSENASQHLLNSGISKERIHFVGNTMIDTLLRFKAEFKKPIFWNLFRLQKNKYIVVTLHRPSNVDEAGKIKTILKEITKSAGDSPVIFPLHPRTKKVLKDLEPDIPNLYFTEPLSYLEFNFLVQYAKLVITDSGGITEETTIMQIPCMTLRDTTERPETVEVGTNELVGTNPDNIRGYIEKLMIGNWKTGRTPDLWDGKAGQRIISILNKE
jgi:UDP-N-acetylglucosamine 2-epimerase (non-hydrolysing)